MSNRNQSKTPSYRHHKGRDLAVVTLNGKDHYLGQYGSPESKIAYDRLIAEWLAGGRRLPSCDGLTIAELIVRFMEERVLPYYVDPVTKEPGYEQENFRHSMRPLSRLYADMPAADFTPRHLTVVRQSMIDATWMTDDEKAKWQKAGRKIGLARTTVNERIARIKMMFRWAAEMVIIPPSVFHGVLAVRGLERGRCGARETDPVTPVAVGVVEATLPFLPPVVRDIVELLLLTGMRVGEAVIMRATDIDMTGRVWLYRPAEHKNSWRGHERVIAIGPRGQDIIRKYLRPKLDAYLFSPAEQAAIIAAEKRSLRKTKVQPSQECRKKANPKKKPGELFDATSVNHAIRVACKKAEVPRWHTHQLRHTAALEISRQHGLESARAVLGHKTVQMSAHYSGPDQRTASEVMAKIG